MRLNPIILGNERCSYRKCRKKPSRVRENAQNTHSSRSFHAPDKQQRGRQRCRLRPQKDRGMGSNLFAMILKLINSSCFPAMLVKLAGNCLLAFYVKSRENVNNGSSGETEHRLTFRERYGEHQATRIPNYPKLNVH